MATWRAGDMRPQGAARPEHAGLHGLRGEGLELYALLPPTIESHSTVLNNRDDETSFSKRERTGGR